MKKRKQKKDQIVIDKKTLFVTLPIIGICVVLLARNKAPETLLFLIGVGWGIFAGKHFQDETKN